MESGEHVLFKSISGGWESIKGITLDPIFHKSCKLLWELEYKYNDNMVYGYLWDLRTADLYRLLNSLEIKYTRLQSKDNVRLKMTIDDYEKVKVYLKIKGTLREEQCK